MDDPRPAPQRGADAGNGGVLGAGVDVYLMPPPGQFSRQVPDVDIHPPGLFASEGRQRTGVDAELSDAHGRVHHEDTKGEMNN